MKKQILKHGIVDPDGIPMRIRWDLFKREGDSVFIPCLNTKRAADQMQYIAKARYMRVRCQVRIENGKYGIRAWRTL